MSDISKEAVDALQDAIASAYERSARLFEQDAPFEADIAYRITVDARTLRAALEPVAAPEPAAIREAWEKAYWRMRSYAIHDNDCKLNKPPRFDGPCSCGLTATLEEALALIQKGAADDRA